MRLSLLLGAVALLAAAPVSAQQAGPDPASTYVHPGHAGEAVRVTTYAERPTERGRLARRYQGLYANRAVRTAPPVRRARAAAPTFDSPRASFIRRGGSYFQVVPAR